jgi:SAM-dependent methyltransferase
MSRDVSDSMRENWNRRARQDPFFYVETKHWEGDVDGFFALGRERAGSLIDPVLDATGVGGPEASALDLGCGLGRFTRALAERFGSVTGVDVSGEMIRRARDFHPESEFPNVSFVEGDGLSLPVDSGSQDFVFSYEVFQHMPSLEVVERNLREIVRVLRPDGVALVHVHTTRTPEGRKTFRSALADRLPDSINRVLKRAAGRDPLVADAAFRGLGPLLRDELESVFAGSGLQVRELRDDPTHPPETRAFVVARPLARRA